MASEIDLERDGNDLFVVYYGRRIAKRGRPGTRQAKRWISLQPGFSVTDTEDPNELIIEFSGASIN
jgi:hypothetical protein